MARSGGSAAFPAESGDANAQVHNMASQVTTHFGVLTDLTRDVQSKYTVLQRGVDGPENVRKSGGVRWRAMERCHRQREIPCEGNPSDRRATIHQTDSSAERSVTGSSQRYLESEPGASSGNDHREGSDGAGGMDATSKSVAIFTIIPDRVCRTLQAYQCSKLLLSRNILK